MPARTCLLALLLLGGPALADDTPTIAVVGVHDAALDRAGQQAIVDRLVTAIDTNGKLDALPPADVVPRVRGREDIVLQNAFLGAGRRLFEDGRILYDQALPEDAIPVLEEAIDALREGVPVANSTRDLWEAWAYLGAARRVADVRGSEDAWGHAVALNPARRLDTTRFPPNVVESYEAVRSRSLAAPGAVEVSVTGGEARVFMNGEPLGTAPVRVPETPPGEVYLVARGAAGMFGAARTMVPSAGTATVELPLDAPHLVDGGTSRFARSRTASALYRALGEQLGTDLVLLAGLVDEKAVLQVYSVRADTFSEPVDIGAENGLTDALLTALPALIARLDDRGEIRDGRTTATAAALQPSANRLLAAILLDTTLFASAPAPMTVPPPSRPEKKRLSTGVLVGGIGGAVALVGGITAVAVLAGGSGGDHGTIIVGPVP